MFFKKLILITSAASAFALLSCSGDNQKAKVPELKAGGCVSRASNQLDKFLDGQATSGDVSSFWSCVQDTIITFEKYTQGEKQDRYKATEIRSFLENYFLEKTRITDDLLLELMHLKRLLVRGDAKEITRAELLRVQNIVEQLREITSTLAPHMRVLASDEFKNEALTPEGREAFRSARTAFAQALQKVAGIIQNNKEDYDLSRLGVLLKEFDKLSKDSESSKGLARFAPLVMSVKAALISQPQETLVSGDFPAVMKMASDMLFVYLESKYYLSQDWNRDQGLKDLDQIVDHAMQILDDGVKRKPNQVILFSELDSVIESVGDLNVLPLDLKAKTVQSSLKVFLQKIFKSQGVAVESVQGLSVDGLNSIRSEWSGFFNAQKFAEKSWKLKAWVDPEDSQDAMELMRAAKSTFPLEKDQFGRVVLDLKSKDWFWDSKSLTSLNWQRLIIHMLVKGYASGENLETLKGLTKEELITASKDFFPLGIDIGFFSPDKPDIAKRIFQEANLFMPRSNGDDLVNYEEGVDYLAYALSGIDARDEFMERTKDICPVTEIDDERTIDVNCFRAELEKNRSLYFGNMPELVKNFAGLDSMAWQNLEKNFEGTVRKNGYQPTPITAGEIVQLFILSQYLETFMLRFDDGRTQSLNLQESLVAFEVYKGTLKELLSGFVSTDDEVLNIYTFMFNYGETPLSGMGGMLRYVNWRVKRENGQWAYEADRVRLSQILSSLSAL